MLTQVKSLLNKSYLNNLNNFSEIFAATSDPETICFVRI